MTELLFRQLASLGWKWRMVTIDHLDDLQKEIENHHKDGSFDDEFYEESLSSFVFTPPDSLPHARSVIIVAVPRPQTRVVFHWNGKQLPLLIPPTYVAYREIDRQVGTLLARILRTEKYRVAKTMLPKKLLAVRGGLGVYGKNNICYVDGMGSFHQLVAFYTDLPCSEDTWQESRLMERCKNCSACLRKCPPGAITSERFLLHAERCITFFNERTGDFPDWIDPGWHNCLVGCLNCQIYCPENKPLLDWVEEKEGFSQEETALLLEGKPLDQLPSTVVAKLKHLSLIEYFDVLQRNLTVLFEKEECPCSL